MIQDIIVLSIVGSIIAIAIYRGVKSYNSKDKEDNNCGCSGGGCS